jgi:hypothetical protein
MTDNESEGAEDRELFEHLVDQFGLHGEEAVSLSVRGPPVNQGSGWMGDLLLVGGLARSTRSRVQVERPQPSEDERP